MPHARPATSAAGSAGDEPGLPDRGSTSVLSLGELGQLGTLEGYDLKQDAGVDTFHLRAALAHPTLARLEQAMVELDQDLLALSTRQPSPTTQQ